MGELNREWMGKKGNGGIWGKTILKTIWKKGNIQKHIIEAS